MSEYLTGAPALANTVRLLQQARAEAIKGGAPTRVLQDIDHTVKVLLERIEQAGEAPRVSYMGMDLGPVSPGRAPTVTGAALRAASPIFLDKQPAPASCWCGQADSDSLGWHRRATSENCDRLRGKGLTEPVVCYHHRFGQLLTDRKSIESWNANHRQVNSPRHPDYVEPPCWCGTERWHVEPTPTHLREATTCYHHRSGGLLRDVASINMWNREARLNERHPGYPFAIVSTVLP